MSNSLKQDCLELSAISKTLYFFDSILGKISIPINLSKLNDACEWYYLKNNKNENIIGVLISMFYDGKEKSALGLNGNIDCSFIGGGKNLTNKNDISCDILKTNTSNTTNLFLNIINRTNNNNNLINNSVDNIKINAKSQFIENNKNKKEDDNNKSNLKLDTTMIYDENLKSPDTSLTNNLFSPFSCRFENDKINLNLTNLNSRFLSNQNNINTSNFINFTTQNIHTGVKNLTSNNQLNLDKNYLHNILEISNNKTTSLFHMNDQSEENFFSFLETRLEKILGNIKEHNISNMDYTTINKSYNNHHHHNNNAKNEHVNKEELLDIINKLKYKNTIIKEDSERIIKENEDIKKQKELLKNNEAKILKERAKLENEIKIFKINRTELENKNNVLSQQINKYTNDLNKLNLEKEVFEFEKNTFFKINFMLNTGKNFENKDYTKVNDIKDFRKKLSINNLSLPATNFTGNSSGSFTSKIIAKGNSQKTSMDVKKETSVIENSILKMKRDNSADIAMNSKKQKHISNVDENILQISSNNLLNNYGSNSLNKNNLSNNNLTYNNIIHNTSNKSFTSNILNNLSSIKNLVNSPKEKKSKQNSSNNINDNNLKKLNLSNSNFNANYIHSGPFTTTNKSFLNNINSSDTPDHFINKYSNNNNASNINSIPNMTQNNNNDQNSLASLKNILNISNQTGSKFYTPIAQIDLNKNKNNLSKMNVISPKGEKSENKLLDSLDSAAYLNFHNKPNIILLGDKKYNLKFKRAGSDDKPKTTNESKRIINNKGNTCGNSVGPTMNISIPSKENKDRKFASKPSLDKQYKSNKDNNLTTSNLSSKVNLIKIDTISNKYNSRLTKKIK